LSYLEDVAEGLRWLDEWNWLEGLARSPAEWQFMSLMGVSLLQRIVILEAEGVSISSFVSAWEVASRRRLASDPHFDGMLLSGGAYGLAGLRPTWKDALHDRLVETFLEPWLEAFFDRFEDEAKATAYLRWKGAVQCVDRAGSRHWIRVKGLIPEICRLHLDLKPDAVLDWNDAPPVPIILSGQFETIRSLARPSGLYLTECNRLTEIHHLNLGTESISIRQCPHLTLAGEWHRLYPPRISFE